MKIVNHPRSADETLLAILTARQSRDCAGIGAEYGMTQERVRVMTDRVIKADSEAEGRDTRPEFRILDRCAAVRLAMARANA